MSVSCGQNLTHSAALGIEEQRRKDEADKSARLRAARLARGPQVKVKDATFWTNDIRDLLKENKLYHFTLEDLYKHEDRLKKLHPHNHCVCDQIRHQLQVLRESGEVFFVDNEGSFLYLALEPKQ